MSEFPRQKHWGKQIRCEPSEPRGKARWGLGMFKGEAESHEEMEKKCEGRAARPHV